MAVVSVSVRAAGSGAPKQTGRPATGADRRHQIKEVHHQNVSMESEVQVLTESVPFTAQRAARQHMEQHTQPSY